MEPMDDQQGGYLNTERNLGMNQTGYAMMKFNYTTQQYYAEDIYTGRRIQQSLSTSARQLRRKVKNYISPNAAK